MRNQRSGLIINISSLNAILPTPFCSAYVSSKFAVEGLTQSLRYELMDFGIKVTSILPGAIKTEIINKELLPKVIQQSSDSVYEKVTYSILQKTREAVLNGSHPKIVANLIVQIANIQEPKIRYFVGEDAQKLFYTISKLSDDESNDFMLNLIKQFNLEK